MGKKEKKKEKKIKGAAKTAAKTEKNALKRMKKEIAATGEDIDAVIASFQEEEKKRMKVIESVVEPPSFRSGLSICAHPEKDELIFFGGEYFNGSKTSMYNELFIYNIKKNKWTQVSSPNAPLPRCSHQAVMSSQGGGQMYIFGGEFSSPTHSQFRHYSDLWIFHVAERRWEQIKATGGPSSRSGHRMVLAQKRLIIFGGFHESIGNYKYFNDVYSFDLETRKWSKMEVVGNAPCPRSGCQIAALPDGRVCVYGGYSREKLRKDVDKGTPHSDMFLLQPEDFGKKASSEEKASKWKWVQIKQSGCRPTPRCGFSVTALAPSPRAAFFGGVYDEENEESLEGHFHNDLFFLELDTGKWTQAQLKGPNTAEAQTKRRRKVKATDGTGTSDDIDKKDEESGDEEVKELEPEVEKLSIETPNVVTTEDDIFTVTIGPQGSPTTDATDPSPTPTSSSVKAFVPHPRMNASLCYKHGILYLYGGMFEEGDRQFTLSDFYALDLHKLDEWKTLVKMDTQTQEWLESDASEGEESESEEGDDGDDEDSSNAEDEEMDVEDAQT